jgi:hypothetical protein
MRKARSSFARGWHISGTLRWWAGQPDSAIERVEAALRLSPRARVGTALTVIGGAHFVSRRFNERVPKLLLAIQENLSSEEPSRWVVVRAVFHRPHPGPETRRTMVRAVRNSSPQLE